MAETGPERALVLVQVVRQVPLQQQYKWMIEIHTCMHGLVQVECSMYIYVYIYNKIVKPNCSGTAASFGSPSASHTFL